jgi:hypothetical protein
VLVVEALALVAMEELLLLLDQFVDAVEYLLVVRAGSLPG